MMTALVALIVVVILICVLVASLRRSPRRTRHTGSDGGFFPYAMFTDGPTSDSHDCGDTSDASSDCSSGE